MDDSGYSVEEDKGEKEGEEARNMDRRCYTAYCIATEPQRMVQIATQPFPCHLEMFIYIIDRFITRPCRPRP